MKCAKAQDLFSSYMENTIEPPLGVAFEQHLAECPQCRADFDSFHATSVLLDELPEVEPPPDFHAAVMAAVERARRTAPRRVRWWNVDWQSVFTVRVPVRAVAVCAAMLLMFVMLAQLTPLGTFTANMLFGSKSTKVADPNAVPAPPPWSGGSESGSRYTKSGPGLSMNVRLSSSDAQSIVYLLDIKTESKVPVEYEAYLLREDTLANDSGSKDPETKLCGGSVTCDQAVKIPFVVSRPSGKQIPSVVMVTWKYDNNTRNEVISLPPDRVNK